MGVQWFGTARFLVILLQILLDTEHRVPSAAKGRAVVLAPRPLLPSFGSNNLILTAFRPKLMDYTGAFTSNKYNHLRP